MAVHDLDHPVCHLVNEIAVMGNGQHRALKSLDIGFQPLHAVQVQVVGGLIQQQDVRFFQQQSCQIDAGLFPAGQAVEELWPLLSSNAQAVADLIHVHIHIIAAAGLEAVHQGIVFPQLLLSRPLGHSGLQGLHLLLCGRQNGKCRAQHILYGVAGGKLGDLGNEAQLFIGIDIDLSPIIVHLPGEDLEKGGLSAAVPAQDGHTLSLLNFKGKALQ